MGLPLLSTVPGLWVSNGSTMLWGSCSVQQWSLECCGLPDHAHRKQQLAFLICFALLSACCRNLARCLSYASVYQTWPHQCCA